MERNHVDLESGVRIEYVDSGGDGPVLVLLHGALMNETFWTATVTQLPPEFRCVIPLLPLGAHREPLPADADVRPDAVARMVIAVIKALDLDGCVLIGSDTGGAIAQLVVALEPSLVGSLVLVSCDAFDNFPPGLPGRVMAMSAAVPGGLRSAVASLRIRPLRRLPLTYGWMAKRPIDDEVFDSWINAFTTNAGVRRDLSKFLRGVDREILVTAATALARFTGPALIVWASEDRVMPPSHAEELAEILPNAEIVWVDDSYTLVPLDRPEVLARRIGDFVRRAVQGPRRSLSET